MFGFDWVMDLSILRNVISSRLFLLCFRIQSPSNRDAHFAFSYYCSVVPVDVGTDIFASFAQDRTVAGCSDLTRIELFVELLEGDLGL